MRADQQHAAGAAAREATVSRVPVAARVSVARDATALPDTYPPESYVQARRCPPGRDEQVRRILVREYERDVSAWAAALDLVVEHEPVLATPEPDTSEPEQAPKRARERENHATVARGLRAKRGARS